LLATTDKKGPTPMTPNTKHRFPRSANKPDSMTSADAQVTLLGGVLSAALANTEALPAPMQSVVLNTVRDYVLARRAKRATKTSGYTSQFVSGTEAHVLLTIGLRYIKRLYHLQGVLARLAEAATLVTVMMLPSQATRGPVARAPQKVLVSTTKPTLPTATLTVRRSLTNLEGSPRTDVVRSLSPKP
jgi:hypothetical protein